MTKRTFDRRTFISTVGACITLGALATTPTTAKPGKRTGFPPSKHTRWGDAGSLNESPGNDTKTFVTVTPSGKPMFAGVYLKETALNNLAKGDDDIFTHEKELILDFPSGTPFEFAMVDWNADGHEPPGIYDLPHFDFHFYFEELDLHSITGGAALYDIPSDQRPPDYIRPPLIDTDDDGQPDAPAIVPHMGEHLIDPTSPEFQGETFTHTHIWGAIDENDDGCGDLIFQEPMITRQFLLSKPEELVVPIKMPAAFPSAGWYPTEYVIRYLGNKDAYAVTLESFEPFTDSTGCSP